MDEIKYLKDTKVEITARRIDNDVYIHQASVIELLKEYKQQFSLQGVSQQRELLIAYEKEIYSKDEWIVFGDDRIKIIDKYISNL